MPSMRGAMAPADSGTVTDVSGSQPPRLGLILPALPPPAWVAAAVEALAAIAQVDCIALCPPLPTRQPRTSLDTVRPIRWEQPEPASIEVAADIWADLPWADLDIVFCLGTRPPVPASVPPGKSREPRLGLWGLSTDRRTEVARDATIAGDDVATLWMERLDDPGIRLREGAVRVHRLSPSTTQQRLQAKASRLPARALGDLLRGETPGRAAVEPSAAGQSSGQSAGQGPAWPRLFLRGVKTGIRRALHTNGWYLGFQIDPPETTRIDPADWQIIRPPRDCFWADPFPVVHSSEQALIYVEEWPDQLGRGRLAALEMNRDGSWQRLGTVMEEPIHLSHPFLFDWEGERYLIPETSARHTVELYRQRGNDPLDWELVDVWMEGERVVDVTVQFISGRWWLLANIAIEGISPHDELHAFFSDSPLGPWTSHAANPIVSDPRRARPAGRIFEADGSLIRPGQDCGRRYGRAITLCQIDELSPTRYVEGTQGRLEPEPLGANRLHTLNTDGWLRVIDLHHDRRRWP